MKRIGFVITPGHQVMIFAVLSVFEFANYALGDAYYEMRLISEHGGPIRSSVGTSIETAAFDDSEFDTVIIGGSPTIERITAGEINFLKRAYSRSRRVAGPCTGALALGAAGLLDGRRATTHWAQARNLQAKYPKAQVEEDCIYIVDGPIWTSAGMTAAIDMALAMVEADLGAEIARTIARHLIVYHRRAGGQAQFSTLLDLDAKSDRIQTALDYAKRNLKSRLSVEDLADAARLSPRQFSRAFRSETRESPAKAVERLRVEMARMMLADTRLSIDEIAIETGLLDRNRLRRAFLRTVGQPPQTIRRNARLDMVA